MVRRPMILTGPWIKRTVFLASWVSLVLILIIVVSNNALNPFYDAAVSSTPELIPPRNQTGAVSYRCWDPKENYRPIYSVCFKNLLAENNNLGVFKTALHKIVKIQGLELEFYRYSSDDVTANEKLRTSPIPEGLTINSRALIETIDKLLHRTDGWRINNLDVGGVSEVGINNFDYKLFYDGELFFRVESKRAMVSYKHSGLILRGHAKLSIADGSTLESNYIEWDVKNQYFTVDGRYVLNRGGRVTIGKDICVDDKLNIMQAQIAAPKERSKENG
jgi:hypothetical protein